MGLLLSATKTLTCILSKPLVFSPSTPLSGDQIELIYCHHQLSGNREFFCFYKPLSHLFTPLVQKSQRNGNEIIKNIYCLSYCTAMILVLSPLFPNLNLKEISLHCCSISWAQTVTHQTSSPQRCSVVITDIFPDVRCGPADKTCSPTD